MFTAGYAYHIKDEYFEKANDDNLMQNKENGQYRPTFYCVKDEKTSVLWVVPMSSKCDKYQKIADKQAERYGKSTGIVIGEFDGRKNAFLIQNMFPITEQYIDHVHTRNGNPVPVNHELQKIIKSNVQQARALTSRGYKVVFPDILRLEKMMIKEIEMSKTAKSLISCEKPNREKIDLKIIIDEEKKAKPKAPETASDSAEKVDLKSEFTAAKKEYLPKPDNLGEAKPVSAEIKPKGK